MCRSCAPPSPDRRANTSSRPGIAAATASTPSRRPLASNSRLCTMNLTGPSNRPGWPAREHGWAVGQTVRCVGTSAHLSPAVDSPRSANNSVWNRADCTQVVQRDIHADSRRRSLLSARALSVQASSSAISSARGCSKRGTFHQAPEGQQRHAAQAQIHHRERSYRLARVCAAMHRRPRKRSPSGTQRDISHSSVERIIFPDSCTLLDYMFGLLTRPDGPVLNVYPENMETEKSWFEPWACVNSPDRFGWRSFKKA